MSKKNNERIIHYSCNGFTYPFMFFKVSNVANLAEFVSKLQNERLALIFANSPAIRQFVTKAGKRLYNFICFQIYLKLYTILKLFVIS